MTGRRPLLALAAAVFVLLQLRISLTPVVPYGWDGAAFIEHVARVDLVQVLSDPDVSGLKATLQAIDGPFPPLLHLLTAPIAALGGQSAEGSGQRVCRKPSCRKSTDAPPPGRCQNPQ